MVMEAKSFSITYEYTIEDFKRAKSETPNLIERLKWELTIGTLIEIMLSGGDPTRYYRHTLGLSGKLGEPLDKRIDMASRDIGPMDLVIQDLRKVQGTGPGWTEMVADQLA